MQEISNRIAKILKSLRQDRGWSLDKTALETGVSKAMLGQIEREESSPTISTLWKIASGFQTSFSSFIEDSLDDSTNPIYRTGHAETLHPDDEKIRVLPLFPFDEQLHFELFVIELLPGCEHLSPPHKHGVIEHVIVVDGTTGNHFPKEKDCVLMPINRMATEIQPMSYRASMILFITHLNRSSLNRLWHIKQRG
ncbi:DNA-binding transcriptional repressor PuuR [Legionella pneumophila]|nr:DNA-binding transcriptional repressor PuuR [Legionella pneumophila]